MTSPGRRPILSLLTCGSRCSCPRPGWRGRGGDPGGSGWRSRPAPPCHRTGPPAAPTPIIIIIIIIVKSLSLSLLVTTYLVSDHPGWVPELLVNTQLRLVKHSGLYHLGTTGIEVKSRMLFALFKISSLWNSSHRYLLLEPGEQQGVLLPLGGGGHQVAGADSVDHLHQDKDITKV